MPASRNTLNITQLQTHSLTRVKHAGFLSSVCIEKHQAPDAPEILTLKLKTEIIN